MDTAARAQGNGHLENEDRRRNLECFAILKLFRQAHGRDAANANEASEWFESQSPKPQIDPFAILTPGEIADFDNLYK